MLLRRWRNWSVPDTQLRARTVTAIHGRKVVTDDPPFELGLRDSLRADYDADGLAELYGRFATGLGPLDTMLRKTVLRALARRCGPGLQIGTGVGFKHPETFEFGSGVFIGAQTYLQGRYDGTFVIGDNVWIGPQSYFDARCLWIGDSVGWGPGAKVLGSTHTGRPADIPIIGTDLEVKPVRIGEWADIGTSATILPGVTVGKAAIVGAGAVVVEDVQPFAVVAGVPARFLHWRPDSEAMRAIMSAGGPDNAG
jgi:acetyltransferase-like isoleucine patch superfamily enzyme